MELFIDYIKCWSPVRNTKSSLSLTVAKASYTLVNFLIYDTEEMELRAVLPLSLSSSPSLFLCLCLSVFLSLAVSLSLFVSLAVCLLVVVVETIKTEADQEVCDKEKPGSRLTSNLSLGLSKLAPSRPAINRVGLTFHH